MATETAPPIPSTPPPAAPAEPDGAKPVGMTQEAFDAVLGRERGAAESKAKRDLLASMGFESVEDAKAAKAAADARKEADLAEMSEAEQLTVKANEAIAAAATIQSSADEREARANLALALLTNESGAINHARISSATTLAMPFLSESDLTGDEAIAAAVAYVRAESPEWFTSVGSAEEGEEVVPRRGSPPPPSKSPGSKPPAPKGDDPMARAKEIYEEWNSTKGKKFDPLKKE